MRESGRTIAGMVGVLRDTPTTIPISGRLRMAKRTEKVCISGSTGRFMTGNGSAALNMGMGFGQALMDAILILANGNTLRLRGMEFTSGKTVIDMKESGNSV
jgi:hypothetical protein